jgi:hypothetical protein
MPRELDTDSEIETYPTQIGNKSDYSSQKEDGNELNQSINEERIKSVTRVPHRITTINED